MKQLPAGWSEREAAVQLSGESGISRGCSRPVSSGVDMLFATQESFLLVVTLVLLAGCSLARPPHPEVHGGLSSQDVANIQSQVRGITKAPLLWIEVSDEYVEAYTGKRLGGIVYLFKRNQAGQLEGCGSGNWDGMP
jgi:hypothetical protein